MCSPSWSPFPLPSPSHPSGSSQCTSPEHLSHASNLGWWSVSPLIVYLFQCSSLRTSHPRLLPQSPKVCSVHLCLFFCFAYRVIILCCLCRDSTGLFDLVLTRFPNVSFGYSVMGNALELETLLEASTLDTGFMTLDKLPNSWSPGFLFCKVRNVSTTSYEDYMT